MLCALLCTALAPQARAQPAAWQGLVLTDHRGQAVDSASLRGSPLLLNFVFTTCSTSCPVQVRELAELQRTLPAPVGSHVRWLSVTVDPLQDTPESLAAFARRMGADLPGWRFVTGAPAQVHRLIDRMQVLDRSKADPQPADHRTALYLFDGRGALVQRYRGVPVDRARLAADMAQLVRAPHTAAVAVR